MKYILLINLGIKHSLVIKFGQFMWKIIFFINIFYEKCGLETSSKPFFNLLEISKSKSEEVCMLILTNFNSFAITYLIYAGCFKNIIFIFLDRSFCRIFWWNAFLCNMTWTGQISLTDCIYFPSYLVKYISCFMLRRLMTS